MDHSDDMPQTGAILNHPDESQGAQLLSKAVEISKLYPGRLRNQSDAKLETQSGNCNSHIINSKIYAQQQVLFQALPATHHNHLPVWPTKRPEAQFCPAASAKHYDSFQYKHQIPSSCRPNANMYYTQPSISYNMCPINPAAVQADLAASAKFAAKQYNSDSNVRLNDNSTTQSMTFEQLKPFYNEEHKETCRAASGLSDIKKSCLKPSLDILKSQVILEKSQTKESSKKAASSMPFTSGFDYSLSMLRMPNSLPVAVPVRKRNFPIVLVQSDDIEGANFYTLNDILPFIENHLAPTTSPFQTNFTSTTPERRASPGANPASPPIFASTLKWNRCGSGSACPKIIEDYSHLQIERKRQRYSNGKIFSAPLLDHLKRFLQQQHAEIDSLPVAVLHYPLQRQATPIRMPADLIAMQMKVDADECDRNTYAFLYGIPKTQVNENLGAIVGRAFAIATVNIRACLKARRFPCNTINPNRPQMISLQFGCRQSRTNFVWQFNSKKVTVADFRAVISLHKLRPDLGAENVFARESLSAKNRDLFDKAKALKHLKLIENAFTYDGHVYVFINTRTSSLRINTLDELERAVMQQQREKLLLRYNWAEHWRRSGLERDLFYEWIRKRDRIYCNLMMF